MKRKYSSPQERKWCDLLTAVFTLCALDSRLCQEMLDGLVAESRRRAVKRVTNLSPTRRRTVDLDALGHVVYQWQRSPRYLDEDGRPLQIAARGAVPSIEALFREIDRAEYFEAGLLHLSQVGRIRKTRNGLYAPCAEVSIVPSLTPEVAEMLTQVVNRLLATVIHNTSLGRRSAIRLVERITFVPDLPNRQIRAFKLFAREQGGALINTMNDWLETHRGRCKPRRKNKAGHLAAGLHVFAFVEKEGN
jgi:Family of unknown function (DUF6502)